MKNQLLCTFTDLQNVDNIITQIFEIYEIFQNKVYVLENILEPTVLYCTYNIIGNKQDDVLPSTISFHRKKKTNTLYTINALNILITQLTGRTDPTYELEWENYKNSIILTAYNELKIIPTKLNKIVTDI